jgi:hypothetical protein
VLDSDLCLIVRRSLRRCLITSAKFIPNGCRGKSRRLGIETCTSTGPTWHSGYCVPKCPISDCGKTISSNRLFCNSDWARIPMFLRADLKSTRRAHGSDSDEFKMAMENAIMAVEVS